MDFSDAQHDVAELVFQGVDELNPVEICQKEVIEVLDAWRNRADHTRSSAELLHLADCPAFSITYEGNAGEYWPSEADNDMVEIFIRAFLYPKGICTITDERIRMLRVRYSLMALAGDEYVLVCPYLTEANNISGIVVVCVTKKLLRRLH